MSNRFNVWMSVSDLMTGLMVIFLFIAVSYMHRVQQNQTVLSDYVDAKKNLHDKLVKEFAGDTMKWQMTIGKDLSMKFNNPQVLFAQGSYTLTPQFKQILNDFLPRYVNILLTDSLRQNISEIRIEGHTDNVPFPSLDKDPYIANMILSQLRALSVLSFMRNMESFNNYDKADKRLLEFWFTASGFSYSRALDATGNYIIKSNEEINMEKSRRVEFRIVTQGDDILENFVKKL